MIEGRKQDGISGRCRKYSKSFGRSSSAATQTLSPDLVQSSSAKGKSKACATNEDVEVDGEGGVSNRADLSNSPMTEDEGNLYDDNSTGSDSELSNGSSSEDGDGSDSNAGDSERIQTQMARVQVRNLDQKQSLKRSRMLKNKRWSQNTIHCCDLEES